MGLFPILLYGAIQGTTEFLPISSSGHLALLPHVLSLPDPGLLFDLGLHLGTALSLLVYFRRQLGELLLGFVGILRTRNLAHRPYASNLGLTTLTSLLFIALLKGISQHYGRAPSLIAFNLVFFGLLMGIVDHWAPRNRARPMDEALHIRKNLWIGLAQALSIFPGVSRSGITLTAARATGLGREEALEFSLFLSLPLILGGFCYKLATAEGPLPFQWDELLGGMAISFIVGLGAIHLFLKTIKSLGLMIFACYRLALGLTIFFSL